MDNKNLFTIFLREEFMSFTFFFAFLMVSIKLKIKKKRRRNTISNKYSFFFSFHVSIQVNIYEYLSSDINNRLMASSKNQRLHEVRLHQNTISRECINDMQVIILPLQITKRNIDKENKLYYFVLIKRKESNKLFI